MLKKPDETLMCSPGHHVVHAHKRVCQSGEGMPMQKKYFLSMRNLLKRSKFIFLLIALTCNSTFGKEHFYEPKGLPLSRNFLKLPDSKWIWLKKVDEHTTKVILGKKFKNRKGKLIN